MRKILSLTIITILVIINGCTQANVLQSEENSVTQSEATSDFKGQRGEFIPVRDEKITIAVSEVDDGNAHYYNTTLPDGDPLYFFIVKSPDGNLRAAANGCQVCGGALQGFRQEGDNMVCNTCGNEYPLNKIATEKGGCNPAPINPDLEMKDGLATITLSELQNIKQFFQ